MIDLVIWLLFLVQHRNSVGHKIDQAQCRCDPSSEWEAPAGRRGIQMLRTMSNWLVSRPAAIAQHDARSENRARNIR